jgi:hypothetical protein
MARLAPRKLRKVETAARQLDVARGELYKRIREAHDAGHSLREIGDAAGLSHEQVRLILLGQVPEP